MNSDAKPLVSVVMGVYNDEDYVGAAIESILAQTLSDFEFIIVDDGSEDDSAEIIRAYMNRDGRIRFFQLERNQGPAAAWNRGIAAASGDLVTLMDSDDLCSPERLRKQVNFLRSNPKVGAVGTHARVVDADLQPLFDSHQPQHHAHIMLYQFIGDSPFVGSSVMLRRPLLLAVGGYDESMAYQSGSDADLMIRLLGRTRFANIMESLYLYRLHRKLTAPEQCKRSRQAQMFRKRRLELLWGEAPYTSLLRFRRLYRGEKLSWKERRAAKRDLRRLIDAMIAKNWVEPADVPLMIADMNNRLEQASPRLWQKFCHWRRHRFGRRLAPPGSVSAERRM